MRSCAVPQEACIVIACDACARPHTHTHSHTLIHTHTHSRFPPSLHPGAWRSTQTARRSFGRQWRGWAWRCSSSSSSSSSSHHSVLPLQQPRVLLLAAVLPPLHLLVPPHPPCTLSWWGQGLQLRPSRPREPPPPPPPPLLTLSTWWPRLGRGRPRSWQARTLSSWTRRGRWGARGARCARARGVQEREECKSVRSAKGAEGVHRVCERCAKACAQSVRRTQGGGLQGGAALAAGCHFRGTRQGRKRLQQRQTRTPVCST